MPDFSTLSRRQKRLQVTLTYQPQNGPLHLLVDSTGIKILGKGEWKRQKHGADYRRQWRKVHLGIDAQTLQIRAIEVTANHVGDAPMLPALLEQIPPEEPIESVSADGTHDTKICHTAIAHRGACALIPVRGNARPWKGRNAGAQARNEILRTTQLLGQTLWKKWSGYHRRSLVETKMRCFKLLGERVMARDFDRQLAELPDPGRTAQSFHPVGNPADRPRAINPSSAEGGCLLSGICATKSRFLAGNPVDGSTFRIRRHFHAERLLPTWGHVSPFMQQSRYTISFTFDSSNRVQKGC